MPISINDEDSPGRHLKRRWDEEDAARDERERQAKQAFLEQEANELFAPVENHLTRLGRVLHAANAVVEVNPTWEHVGDRKLCRVASVLFKGSAQRLDFTIEGVTIFYRDRRYRFTTGIETLILVITSDVEQFITAQSQAAAPVHLALASDQPLLI